MLLEVVLSDKSVDGLNTVCASCRENIAKGREALLQRERPDGKFTVLCVSCAKWVCQAAADWMELLRGIDDLMKL